MAGSSSDAFELHPAPFDAPHVYALVVAQQVELTGRDGRGLGRLLLEGLEDAARGLGYTAIVL